MEQEKWKVVKHYPKYVVSNFGAVRRADNSKTLKPFKTGDYGYVSLSNDEDGRHDVAVHVLVHTHFVKRVSKGNCVHHKDEDKTNNRYDNLEQLSRGEHIRLHRMGRKLSEETRAKMRAAKRPTGLHLQHLSDKMVIAIYKSKKPYKEIAARYAVGYTTVCAIKRKQSHKDLLSSL